MKRTLLFVCLLAAVPVMAQSLVTEALNTFPADTAYVEYDNLLQLRTVNNFEAIATRYSVKRVQALKQAFQEFGLNETDVDEVVIGSRVRGGSGPLFGLVNGRISFGPDTPATATPGFVIAKSADKKLYCLPSEKGGLCIATADGGFSLFGPFERVHSMLEVYRGLARSLGANESLYRLLSNGETVSPTVKGLSSGSELAPWIKASLLPASAIAQAAWPSVFSNVAVFSYSVTLSTKAHVTMQMECKSPETAAILEQELEVLKLVATNAQTILPTEAAPFDNIQIKRSGAYISMNVDSPLPDGQQPK